MTKEIKKISEQKGSLYSSTGGHILHGEEPIDAIKRETKEELEIDILIENIVSIGNIIVDFPVRFIFFLRKI